MIPVTDIAILTGESDACAREAPFTLLELRARYKTTTSLRKLAEIDPSLRAAAASAVGVRHKRSKVEASYSASSVDSEPVMAEDALSVSETGRDSMLRTSLRREWISKRRRENDDLTLLAARRIFGALDVDNDGCLSGDELEHLAAWMWSTFNESDGQPTKAELDEAMDYSLCLMDVNNTGVIDFQSFFNWFSLASNQVHPHVLLDFGDNLSYDCHSSALHQGRI